jgi:predicted nucleotidyltransferase
LGPTRGASPQLDRVVRLADDVLGSNAVGAYLFGSAVLGGLRPESDVDVLVVATRRTTAAEARRLVDRLRETSGREMPRGRWRRVEISTTRSEQSAAQAAAA